ncbi:Ger(x)C family spore germination protein [Cohnella sp. GCM10012308]|uniref:Ger(x)C family spore germination protein n=1 Tax=Cohnella sp. GCM10012308 TaxID=3317329 RepID=UPI00361ECA3A
MILRRTLLRCLCLTLLLMLSGCQLKDIDKRYFVVSAGFDYSDNPAAPYRVSLRLALPSSKVEEGGAMSVVQTVDAASIAEAVRHLKSTVDKELEFGHCREFILGRKLIEKDGIDNSMQWLSRRRDIQSVSNVMIGDPDAYSVVNLKPKSERYPGNSLFLSFGNEGTESANTVTTYLFDLYRRVYETGLDPVLPVASLFRDAYRIDRAAMLDKQKTRLFLDPDETLLFNMMAFGVDNTILVLPDKPLNIVLAATHTTSKINLKGGEDPTAVVNVRIEGFLEQSPPHLLEKDWRGLERKMGRHFSEEAEKLLYKIRDAGVDPYGFGLHYLADHHNAKGRWEKWKRLYPEIRFEVHANVSIQGSGLIR